MQYQSRITETYVFTSFGEGKKLISLGLIQIDVILNYFLLFTKIMQLDGVTTIKKIGVNQMSGSRHSQY